MTQSNKHVKPLHSDNHAALPQRWEALLQDVEKAFGVGITVHDLQGLLRDEDDTLLLKGRHLHPHALCARRPAKNPGETRCVDHCSRQVHDMAEKTLAPFTARCWKGITEVVVPVLRHGRVVLILFAGPFREEQAPDSGPTLKKHLEAWSKLPILSNKERDRLTRLLLTLGQGIFAEAEAYLGVAEGSADRKRLITRFVFDHAQRPVELRDLAEALHLSPSRAGHLVSELFGIPFKMILINERIKRAKALLLSTHLDARVIAERIGLPNPHYFSRLFKRETGQTPLQFRKHGAEPKT